MYPHPSKIVLRRHFWLRTFKKWAEWIICISFCTLLCFSLTSDIKNFLCTCVCFGTCDPAHTSKIHLYLAGIIVPVHSCILTQAWCQHVYSMPSYVLYQTWALSYWCFETEATLQLHNRTIVHWSLSSLTYTSPIKAILFQQKREF